MRLWDRCGHPLAQLDSGRYVHVFPVTVYHVERYIWSTAPRDLSADDIPLSGRPAPDGFVDGDLLRLWATGLTLSQADAVAAWLGGSVCARADLQAAHGLKSVYSECVDGDARISRLVRSLSVRGHSQMVSNVFSEMTTDHAEEPRGRLLLMSPDCSDGIVTHRSENTYRSTSVGFRCVFQGESGLIVREQ